MILGFFFESIAKYFEYIAGVGIVLLGICIFAMIIALIAIIYEEYKERRK